MSKSFVAATKALKDNPELFGKVSSASSAEERAEILRDHGLDAPSHADVNSHVANMAGVSGGLSNEPTMPVSVDGGSAFLIAAASAIS